MRTRRFLLAVTTFMGLGAGCDALTGAATATREAPCTQVRALHFDAGTGWLACAGSFGGGVWKTTDGGSSWTHAADLGGPASLRGSSSRFNDIEAASDGSMYFCGGDNDTSPKVFVYRVNPGGDWEPLVTRETLLEGGGRGFSDCQNIAIDDDFLLIDDNAGSQIAWSHDRGATWSKADVGQISELAIVEGAPLGAGGTTGDGPRFYRASDDEMLLTGELLGAVEGLQEARGMATPDGGRTWIVAGARDGAGGAFVWRSTDGGVTWEDTGVEALDVSFFEDVACLDLWCVAVGRSYPDDEGLAYESSDAGVTWSRRALGSGLTPFYTAHAGDGAIWAAGDGTDLLRLTP